MSDVTLFEAMRTTRTVRRLRPDPIPDDVLRRVLEAATHAPSGGNRQPWRFVVVRDAETKRRLADLYRPLWQTFSQAYVAQLNAAPIAMYALIITAGVLGIVINLAARAAERKVLFWHESVRAEVPA